MKFLRRSSMRRSSWMMGLSLFLLPRAEGGGLESCRASMLSLRCRWRRCSHSVSTSPAAIKGVNHGTLVTVALDYVTNITFKSGYKLMFQFYKF